MIDDADRERELDRLAAALAEADATRRPIDPIGAGRPWLGVAEAYAIQRRIVGPRIAGGDEVVGWKVGLTSRAMQEQLGVDQPDYAALLASMRVAEGSPIRLADLIQPRIEAEVAFLLARPLRGPGVTRDDVLAATAAVLPSFEVIDSRITGWQIGLVDTVADVASSARFVLGQERVAPDTLDLPSIAVTVTRNGVPAASGAGSAVLGDPAIAVAWAANTLGALGETLAAGHVILPGAVHASIPALPGDAFVATFSGLGSVRATFA